MNPSVQVDLLIIGGGIAGLWLLARARREGYSAVLIEGDRLGGGQTVNGQGFVLGQPIGMGELDGPTRQAFEAAPERWRRVLAEGGELAGARMLSERPYLWTVPSGGAGGGFSFVRLFRRKAAVEATPAVVPDELPNSLHAAPLKGELRVLDGLVLDTRSLIEALAAEVLPYVFRSRGPVVPAPDGALNLRAEGHEAVVLRGRRTVFAAGSGSSVLGSVPLAVWHQQMVMVRAQAGLPDDLFLNVVDGDGRRRFNLTSHRDAEGRSVWYIGGGLAEAGSHVPPAQQIAATRRELAEHLSWIDLDAAEFATVRVERAAARQRGATLALPVVRSVGNAITAWPASLTVMPAMIDQVIEGLRGEGLRPAAADLAPLEGWPRPELAHYPWDDPAAWR